MLEERPFHAFNSYSKKFTRRQHSLSVAFDRRAMGSRRFDPVARAAAAAVRDLSLDQLEGRQMLAAHIAGSNINYSTIQAAVNAATPGQTINVDAGTYNETVTIYTPNLAIRGANAGVDGRGARNTETIVYATQTVFDVFANDTTIDGFTIQGNRADIGALLGAGVLMRPNIHGTHVTDNIIQNNVTGVYLSNNSNTDQCLIQHNLIQNNFEANNSWTKEPGENGSRGIYTDGTVSGGYLTNVLIDANNIYNYDFNGGDEDEGIIALQALTAGKQFNITISNNYWGGDSKALLATNVTNLTIIGNYITGTTDGSSGPVRFEGNANTVNIQYNTITGNGGPGVAVDDSGVSGDNSGFVINNNNIYGNNGNIGFITQASLYNGTVYAQGDWWGNASGPAGDGNGTGSAVWANGTSGHYLTPTGAAGGSIVFSPWATALINIANIPAPTAANALTVSPGAGSQLALSWTPPMSTATAQLIQRSTDGVNFTTIAVVPPLLNSFTDTGLTVGISYTYRIITSNASGTGPASSAASGIPPAYQAPMPPAGVAVTTVAGSNISLSWDTPAYPFGITGYTVYRNGTPIGTSTSTSFTDSSALSYTANVYTIKTNDSTGASSAASAPFSVIGGVPQFQDASFEQTPWSYSYDPATSYWTFTGNAAIAGNNSNFGGANAPDGTQAAFLQGYNGGTIGAVTQTVSVGAAGQFTISFAAARRANYALQPVAVLVDGTQIAVITPTSNSWAVYTTPTFSLTAGAHVFRFQGTSNTGDSDSFIDTVSLNRVSGSATIAVPVLPTATAVSSTSIALTWSPGSTGVTGYSIQRSTDGTTWTSIASQLASTATSYLDSTVAAGTTYFYRISALAGTVTSTAATASATTLAAGAIAKPLTTLNWSSATTGYSTVKQNASVANNTLTLHGTTYATGLGTSAVSVIQYNLGGGYKTFSTDVGIDAEEYTASGTLASVDFQVIGDGVVLFDSGNLTTSSPTVHITVPVTSVQTLTLVATNGVAGIAYDHGDWAGATLYSNPVAPAAPTSLAAAALSSTAISLSWIAPSGGITGYAIDRSGDGVNFASIAGNVAASTTSYIDSTALSASTNYSYRIRALNTAGTSPNSTVATATTLANNVVTTNLSSLSWTTATSGYSTVQKNLSIGGNTLSLRGNKYFTGLGTHAASTITYTLGGNYSNFLSDVGIDDEEVGKGPGYVGFKVIGDGVTLFDSGVLTNTSPVVSINVSVVGVQTLQLVATNGIANNIDYDHADWAGAKLVSSAAQALVAPTNLTAVSSSPTQVALAWSSAAPNATGFNVLRSTDDVNFTTIAGNLAATARTYLDTSAVASTGYSYKIVALAGSLVSPASNVATVATISATAVTTNLSTLNWTSATAGYGTVQKNQTIAGQTMTLRGTTYATGIGTHAASTIVYNLGGKYTNFLSDIGIDDEEIGKGTGSVDFQVIGDGTVLFDSGVLTNTSAVTSINVNVTGVQTLTLVATNGVPNSIDYDHADWAGARLLGNAVLPTAPTSLAATAVGPSTINLSWTNTATAQTSLTVLRSTDGVNFTTVATGLGATATSWSDASILSAGTKYFYKLQAVGTAGVSPLSNVANATTLQLQTVTYVSDLTATSSTVGYGTIQKDKSISGNPLTLNGVTYSKGIGTHAASSISYNIGGKFSTFTAIVGIDQEEDTRGNGYVDFQIIGDGKILFDSGVLTNDQVAAINVSVVGVQNLQLVATNGVAGSIDYDHADWVNALLNT